jgi:hypothetical protein
MGSLTGIHKLLGMGAVSWILDRLPLARGGDSSALVARSGPANCPYENREVPTMDVRNKQAVLLSCGADTYLYCTVQYIMGPTNFNRLYGQLRTLKGVLDGVRWHPMLRDRSVLRPVPYQVPLTET